MTAVRSRFAPLLIAAYLAVLALVAWRVTGSPWWAMFPVGWWA